MAAVTELQLRLLGVPGASLDGRPVALRRRTSLALLAYLALTGRRYTRSMLAGILAGDASEEQAQKRVGNTLTDLRAAVGEHLHVTREWVAFDRQRPHWIDVAEFEAQVAACTNPLEAPAAATAALDLYHGEFLAGVSLSDAPEFDEWLTLQRERLRLMLAQALQAALKGYVQNGTAAASPAAGIALARRLLELDPWNEDAHQALMALLARNGQRGAALSHYAVCRRVLADELGVDPSPETAALAARLRTAPVAAPHNLPARAAGFVGRHEELALVAGRLADPACRLVTLVGLGGSGKTALAIEAARRFVAPEAGLGEPLFPDGVFVVPLAEAALAATDAPAAARAPAPDTAEHAAARVGAAIGRALERLPEKGPGDEAPGDGPSQRICGGTPGARWRCGRSPRGRRRAPALQARPARRRRHGWPRDGGGGAGDAAPADRRGQARRHVQDAPAPARGDGLRRARTLRFRPGRPTSSGRTPGSSSSRRPRGCARRRRSAPPSGRLRPRCAGCSTATPWRSSSRPAACAG